MKKILYLVQILIYVPLLWSFSFGEERTELPSLLELVLEDINWRTEYQGLDEKTISYFGFEGQIGTGSFGQSRKFETYPPYLTSSGAKITFFIENVPVGQIWESKPRDAVIIEYSLLEPKQNIVYVNDLFKYSDLISGIESVIILDNESNWSRREGNLEHITDFESNSKENLGGRVEKYLGYVFTTNGFANTHGSFVAYAHSVSHKGIIMVESEDYRYLGKFQGNWIESGGIKGEMFRWKFGKEESEEEIVLLEKVGELNGRFTGLYGTGLYINFDNLDKKNKMTGMDRLIGMIVGHKVN